VYYLVIDVIRAFNDPNSYFKMLNHELVRTIFEFAFEGIGPMVTVCVFNQYKSEMRALVDNDQIDCPFRICIRKRPMMRWEREANSYDVVNSQTSLAALTPNLVTIHNGRLARSGRQLSMAHLHYFVSRYFSESDSNEVVSSFAIEPHLSWAECYKDSTILFYGQTGTGKTHSMVGTLEYIARRLVGRHVEVTFYEIRGKKCYDLFNERTVVNVRADEQNNVHVRGCRTVSLESLDPLQFLALMTAALSLRTSAETERNPLSSRSHAICTIELYSRDEIAESFSPDNAAGEPTKPRSSRIRLVDLAGSERNYETWSMTAEDHRDSADINFTLMALKDCFRAYNYERIGKVCSLILPSPLPSSQPG
jgi:kinesin family member 2/24